jgi:hypothetical protein
MWRHQGWTYQTIASELRRCGILSPWGGAWGQASIGRYFKRALRVSALKAARWPSDLSSSVIGYRLGSKNDRLLACWRSKTRRTATSSRTPGAFSSK